MIKYLKIINFYRSKIFFHFQQTKKQVEWRINNSHNTTTLSKNVKDSTIISVGRYSYGEINTESFGNKEERLEIGNFVSIAKNVVFILGGNHQTFAFTSFPLKSIFIENSPMFDAQTKGAIIVEDEVWIGNNVVVLSGIKIGKGAIIAAGSIITKDVPPYSVVGGNPAKFIKWRIPESLIEKRNHISLSDINIDIIKENQALFYKELDEEVLNKIAKLKNN